MKHTKITVPLTRDAATERGQEVRIGVLEKIRPRWWYIAIADCSNTDLAIKYEFHAVNDPYGWAQEFSTDRRFELYVFVILLIIYVGLAVAQRHVNACLTKLGGADSASSKAAHPFARMLFAGILLGLGAAIVSVFHSSLYASNGYGSFVAYVVAKLLSVSSNFVLASLLLLVSEGKCISYVMVVGDAWRMCRLLAPFLCACVTLELWGDFSNSRNYTTDYVYATPFGWAVVLVELCLVHCRPNCDQSWH